MANDAFMFLARELPTDKYKIKGWFNNTKPNKGDEVTFKQIQYIVDDVDDRGFIFATQQVSPTPIKPSPSEITHHFEDDED